MTNEQFKKLIDTLHRTGRGGRAGEDHPLTVDTSTPGSEERSDTADREIARTTKELEEQTKQLELLDKQYSSMSQGTLKEYKKAQQAALIDHTQRLKDLAQQYKTTKMSASDYAAAQRDLANEFDDTSKKLASQEGLVNNLTRLGSSMLGLNLKSGSGTQKMVQLAESMKEAAGRGNSMSDAVKKMAKNLAKNAVLKVIESLERAMKAYTKITTDFILGQDKAISSFRKATGAGKEFNNQIADLSIDMRLAGVTTAEQGAAFTELYSGMSSFTELSKKEQNSIAKTTILLGEMGVSAGDSAKIMDQMTRALGMSAPAAEKVLLDLAGTAESIGVPMGKLSRDFQGAFSELSKYGHGATGVFKDLAVQSKKTGIEVNRLMSITKQYDTFEGAATAVGKLNAILGGPYLNSIDMLNATESERIENIRKTLDLSGQQFEAMNRFEKMAIADALGMSVEEASRIFQMSSSEMQLRALEQEELREKAQDMQTMTDKIKSALTTLALDMRPVINDVIMPMIDGFSKSVAAWAKAKSHASAFANTMKLVSGILAGMLIPLAGLVAVLAPGVGWPLAAAMLAAAGALSLGGGAMAGTFVQNRMDDVAASRADAGDADTGSLANYSTGGPVRGAATPWRANYTSGVPINMNELGKEGAIVPDGTYIATASNMRESIQASQLVVAELKGLRADLAGGKEKLVKLVLDDGQEFAAYVVNNAGLTPFA